MPHCSPVDLKMSAHAAPTYTGVIDHPDDVLFLIQACRQGYAPRIRRKLHESEKLTSVKSGSVFVWVEQESQIHRWTDGHSWSASRAAHGGFLLYREMSRRGGGRTRTAGAVEIRRSLRYEGPQHLRFHAHVRSLTGSLLNKGEFDEICKRGSSGIMRSHDKFKRGGLIKKTFSLDMPGEKWHIVSYYSLEDALSGCFHAPRESPIFQGISILNASPNIRSAFLSRNDSASTPPDPEASQYPCATSMTDKEHPRVTDEFPAGIPEMSMLSGSCDVSWRNLTLEISMYSTSSELHYALIPSV